MEQIYGEKIFWKNSKIGPPRASKIQAICPAEIWPYSLIPLWQAISYKIMFLQPNLVDQKSKFNYNDG